MNIESRVKIFVFLIWIFFISSGVSAGLNFPDNDATQAVGPPFSNTMLYIFIGFPFVISFSVGWAIYYLKDIPTGLLGQFMDKILGKGFSDLFKKNLRFHILGPLFFLLIGSIGMVRVLLAEFHGMDFYRVLFPLSFGAGLTLSQILVKLLIRK